MRRRQRVETPEESSARWSRNYEMMVMREDQLPLHGRFSVCPKCGSGTLQRRYQPRRIPASQWHGCAQPECIHVHCECGAYVGAERVIERDLMGHGTDE